MNVTEACREVRHSKKFSKFLEVTSLNFYQNDYHKALLCRRSLFHFGDFRRGLKKERAYETKGLIHKVRQQVYR